MRVLVMSDIHGNLTALEAVLEDAEGKWDQIWCLGDLIGYGPFPNECVALLREFDHKSLSGNHDWAALGKLDIDDFNDEARRAVLWTRDTITPETRDFLDGLPAKRVEGKFTLAHASPRHPVWEYIVYPEDAQENFAHFDTPICLVGHTHVPVLFAEDKPDDVLVLLPTYAETIFLEDARAIINPGSVGQPRDSDPRAAYAFLDTQEMSWEFHRVPYDIAKTQEAMRNHNMPFSLVDRLEWGF